MTSLINECFYRLEIRTTTHTNDEENTNSYNEYSETIIPKARLFEQIMTEKLLESGFEPDNFSIPLRKMRTDAALFREDNLPLKTRIEKLTTKLQKLDAARVFNWDGEELTERQMLDKLMDSDRKVREQAWRILTAGIKSDDEPVGEIWSQLLDLRQEMARNAGFDD